MPLLAGRLIQVFIRYYLICEYEPIVLSAIIFLLTVNILLLLYLLAEKICLRETDQVNSSSLPDNKFLRIFKPTVNSYDTPLSVEQ